MMYAGGSFMGSFLGTLFTGGGPGGLATALLLYMIAFHDYGSGLTSSSGWLLGLLFLTHPLTAMVAMAYLSIYSFYHTCPYWNSTKPPTPRQINRSVH